MEQPLGVRLNNPGNLEWGSPWQGLVPRNLATYAKTGTTQQKRFCEFESPVYGVRAIAVTLITYQDKRRARDGSRIDSAREIVERWAPAADNNNETAYAKAIGVALGIAPDDEVIDMHNYDQLRAVVEAIIRHENGNGPVKTPNTWYNEDVISKGLMLAGVERHVPAKGGIVVTRETLGATATGGVGLSQLAEAAPSVMDAVTNAQDSLTSGQISRVVVGLVLVGLAVFIALSQVSKYKKGLL